MRVDANVSIRPVGTEPLGTKVEVKNMNSLRSLGRAIDYEIARQIQMMETGERIVQETRGWDEAAGLSQGMRSKEGSNDYRYFPEPDLVPVAPSEEMRAAARAAVPELPAEQRARYVERLGSLGPGRACARRQPAARGVRRRGGRASARRARTSSTGAPG